MTGNRNPLTDEEISWLRCPACHAPLQLQAAEVSCADCRKSGRVRYGVVDLTESTCPAEGERLGTYARVLPELVKVAERDGWYKALNSIVRPLPDVGSGMFSYVTDESKSDLIFAMNIQSGQKVLDLGCGLGPVSVALAQRGAECHVLDVSFEQTAFTALRCHQSGFADVKGVCAGDDLRLPFADEYFDAVIMNGVIEWVGCTKRFDGSAEDAQLAMLREAHRVLKTGGQLYVSSKNRYSLYHLLGGAPDHVTKLPWIGLLSPRLQRLLTRGRVGDSGARIRGLRAYRRLLSSAGFVEIVAYALMPEFRHPKRFIPLSQSAWTAFRGPAGTGIYNRRLEGLLAGLLPPALLKYLVYCYGFLLEKE